MREELRDPLRLDQMLEAIEKLLLSDREYSFDNYTEKDIEYFGIIKLLEIVGEAAYKLTNEFKDSHSSTPWKMIIGMRHVLVHGYYQINRKDILATIRNDLPILRTQIKSYLEEFDR